jgi:hypothetical protein
MLMSRATWTVSLSRVGYTIVLAGAIVLVGRWLAQYPLASPAVGSGTDRAAIRGAWIIGTSQLRDTGIIILVVGAVVAVGSWALRVLTR